MASGPAVVIVVYDGNVFFPDVKACKTILEVKDFIHNNQGIPRAQQRLLLDGHELDNEYIFTEPWTELRLVNAFPIFVTTLSGAKITVYAEGTWTIRKVKSEIHELTSIPLEQQVLLFHELELIDEHTLSAFAILSSVDLTLVRKPQQIQTTLYWSRTREIFDIKVMSNETLEDLKLRIQELTMVSVDHPRLWIQDFEEDFGKMKRVSSISDTWTLLSEGRMLWLVDEDTDAHFENCSCEL